VPRWAAWRRWRECRRREGRVEVANADRGGGGSADTLGGSRGQRGPPDAVAKDEVERLGPVKVGRGDEDGRTQTRTQREERRLKVIEQVEIDTARGRCWRPIKNRASILVQRGSADGFGQRRRWGEGCWVKSTPERGPPTLFKSSR